MRIWIDRERLAAFNLTVQDIENALRAQNVELPSGRHRKPRSRVHRAVAHRPVDPRAVRQHRRQARGGPSGQAQRGRAHRARRAGRAARQQLQRQPAIVVGIIKQATANPLDVSQGVRAVLPEINQSLPEGMSAEIGNDSAVFIDRSIRAVFHDDRRGDRARHPGDLLLPALVPRRAHPDRHHPVSLIATFALMYVLGFSVNTLTLLAMVLAIGLVVDDAIVVLENIYRHIEDGMKPVAASIRGIARDRLCRRRDDADPGRRLRAGGVRAWPDRQAVPGIRPDARRRRARVGLRRADADADDVLEAPAAQSESGAAIPVVSSGCFTASKNGYRRWLTASLACPAIWFPASPSSSPRSACVFFFALRSELSPDRGSRRRSRCAAPRRKARRWRSPIAMPCRSVRCYEQIAGGRLPADHRRLRRMCRNSLPSAG